MFTSIHQLKAKNVGNGERGFTLVELLIVVAIIGILAAIAIPQFAAYRIRSYNASGASDIRNARTAEEALFADSQLYGPSANATLAAAPGSLGAAGALLNGPMSGASTAAAGGMVTTTNATTAAISAVPIALGNGVNMRADTVVGNASYVIFSRHELGDTAYGVDTDNQGIYLVRNGVWPGTVNVLSATLVVPTNNIDDFNGSGGGGVPTANWTIQ